MPKHTALVLPSVVCWHLLVEENMPLHMSQSTVRTGWGLKHAKHHPGGFGFVSPNYYCMHYCVQWTLDCCARTKNKAQQAMNNVLKNLLLFYLLSGVIDLLVVQIVMLLVCVVGRPNGGHPID